MALVLLGLNHRSAPIGVREKLSVGAGELRDVLKRLAAAPGVSECWMLSTCNRVELLAQVSEEAAPGSLERFLEERSGAPREELGPHLYRLEAAEAVAHLFRVASGLDSLVVGEPQILGQAKEAYAAAREAATLGRELDPLLQRTFAVAKRVRSETGIGRSSVSVARAAVELAEQIFGDLQGRSILLVGTGKMAELATRHLVSRGVGKTVVASRTLSHAVAFAERVGGEAIPAERMPEALERVDIVIGSTAAPHPVILRSHVETAMLARRRRRLFLIDIAVPRDVEPSVDEIDDVYLYNIDDLQSVVETNRTAREGEARAGESIIRDEVAAWKRRSGGSAAGGTITALLARAERVRADELQRARARLGPLSPRQEEQVEALARNLVAKLIHGPVSSLRRHMEEGGDPRLLEFARQLFEAEGATPAPETRDDPDVAGGERTGTDVESAPASNGTDAGDRRKAGE
jgi:glutamyl-tRNA reductase